jgi:hypothetical protein
MTVTEKLNQAELSISSWDSSEWAPHAVETVAVKARKSRVRAFVESLGISASVRPY